ncbi:MAG TPA: WD40 repeat domain-containing protein [Patescibacteria group bacterium]|nr:WD40 repeat domain-containing protein [Patescibacteria group bacterium]
MKKWLPFVFLFLFFFCLASFSLAEEKMNAPSGGMIPKLATTPNDPELLNGHVYPSWGPVCQRYTYSVVYRDKEGRPPQYIQIYFNGQMIDIEKENPEDNDYQKGVKYIYQFVPKKLGSNFYYFEASNGLGKARDSIIDSPDNGPVLFESAFDQNEIAVINQQTGERVLSYPTGKEWVGGVALSDDGKYLAAKTSHHIYLFDLAFPKAPIWSYEQTGGEVGGDVKGGIDISGDGSRIIAGIGDSVLFFDKTSNNPLWQAQIGNTYNVAISKDGRYMAAATVGEEANLNSNLLILWDYKSEKPLWQYHSSGNFHDVSLSADGSFIAGATGCPDRRAYIFSKESNVPIMKSEMLTRDSPVHRAKISSDGQLVAFGTESDRGAVFLFSKDSTKPLWQFPVPGGSSVRALNFTPSGEYIGATTFAGNAYIFAKDSNQPVASWQVQAALGGVDIADDGSFLATGGTDNKLHLLFKDSQEKKEVSFDEYVEEIDISGNGKYIAVGTGGSVYFFESFSKDEGKVFPCEEIIEPEPEGAMLDVDSNIREGKENKLPSLAIFFGLGTLVSLLALGFYFALVRFNLLRKPEESRLKISKKVIIPLAVLTGLFLILALFFGLKDFRENSKIPSGFPLEESSPSGSQEVCGNTFCEPNLGETKESCSQDCSMGD